MVASFLEAAFELQEIVFLSWPYSLRGHRALKILCLWKLNPFPSTDVYRLLECWAKIKPGNCIQMPGVSTLLCFQLVMAHATVSIGPFMYFQKHQGLKFGVHGAGSAEGATSG